MKIVLLKDVKGIGKIGDEKEVSIGHANNLLIPKKLAAPLTTQLRDQLERTRVKKIKSREKQQEQFNEIVKKIKGITVSLKPKTNEQGTLFKAISMTDIKNAIEKQGYKMPDSAKVVIKAPIKAKGMYDVDVLVLTGASASIKVHIK